MIHTEKERYLNGPERKVAAYRLVGERMRIASDGERKVKRMWPRWPEPDWRVRLIAGAGASIIKGPDRNFSAFARSKKSEQPPTTELATCALDHCLLEANPRG